METGDLGEERIASVSDLLTYIPGMHLGHIG
jgi:hypothetical protein